MELKNNKGKLVFLTYNGRNEKKQIGIITAVTNDHILFNINGEYEKPIQISKISHIEQLKSFSHYIRTAKRYLNDLKPDKAIYCLNEMLELFNLLNKLKIYTLYETKALKWHGN